MTRCSGCLSAMCSSAELSPADKNQLSHRARAMDLLRQRLGLK
jgi:XTP/dITP diphosphohydrolase